MSKTMNKVMRYEIIKPLDTEWSVFNKLLYDLQYDTRQILNKTIQLCWEYYGFSADYKEKNNEYPKNEDVLKNDSGKGYKMIGGYIENKLKKQYYRLNTSNLAQTVKRATDKWKSDLIDVLKGEKSIPTYKKGVPIDVKGSVIKLSKDKSNYNCSLSLASQKYADELGRKGIQKCQFKVALMVVGSTQKAIIDRLIDGTYKVSGSQIIKHKHKNKWFLNLCYQFEVKDKGLDENNIMGIDMGVVNPVYIAFNNSYKRSSIEGDEITVFRRRIEARRNSLLRQAKYCGDGRIGHGRATRIKPIEKLRDRVDNFKKTTNHKYSRYVIDLAKRNNCGTIQMEDLSGIAANEKKATFLGDWTYYDLQQKIEYKAKENGIKVVKIKPNFTSQRCSKCGFIHKDNRKTQESFKCTSCDYGHKFFVSADYNAAKNIATKGIEKIISDQLKKQEKERKNAEKYLV